MNNLKKTALLVCQAPVEVPNILQFYEEVRDKYNKITFVSRDTNSYNDFFKYLGIKANYVRWVNDCRFDSFKPQTWTNFRKQILNNLSNLQLENCDVYYSSRFDFFSYCHFKEFPKSATFIYRDKRDSEVWCNKGQGKVCLKSHIRMILDKYIKQFYCGVELSYYNCGSNSILGFDPLKLGHIVRPKLSDDEEIQMIKKYSYTPNVKSRNVVIFFTEPYRNRFHDESDYIVVNRKIVEELHNRGYYVVLKGHPRLGICEEIRDIVDEIIPSYIPSEFIDYSNFTKAVGFVSTALCGASKYIPTYSVLDICSITDEHLADYWRIFLNKNSSGNIIFLKDIADI